MTVDREQIIQKTNLAAIVERDLGAPAKRSGRWLFWRCPFHDERTPSLGVTADNGQWHCFGCGASGNVIDWVIRYDKVGFLEACRRLGEADIPALSGQIQRSQTNDGPPGEPWQSRALDLVYGCQTLLWQDASAKALAYLHKRGFTDDTIWTWRLGFQPDRQRYEPLGDWGIIPPGDGQRHMMWIPRGITMPCFDEDGETLRYVKVCRGRKDRWGKYIKLRVPGGCSGAGLYGAEWLQGQRILFIDEGEFNALTIWQEVGDLVDVASTGSASIRPETLQPWWPHFLMARYILARFDEDRAGDHSIERWHALTRRLRPVQVPAGDDPNAFLVGGGDVRAWIQLELARL